MDLKFGDKNSYGYRGELESRHVRYIRENNKEGLIDSDGHVLLECKYDNINCLRCSWAHKSALPVIFFRHNERFSEILTLYNKVPTKR